MRRSRSPESTFRRELFERSEFSRHHIRGVGGGTWKRRESFSSLLWKAADGRKWFWALLGNGSKSLSSKAAGREKPEAYGKYVEGFDQRERSWRTFGIIPLAETKVSRLWGDTPHLKTKAVGFHLYGKDG